MNWLTDLFTHQSIAQTVLVYSLLIGIGVTLGKVKVFNVSLHSTWVLFVALFASYAGVAVDHETVHFLKDFGLVLFIYALGLQVGPGFFASLKKQALVNNLISGGVVLIGAGITILLLFLTGTGTGVMTGIMSGAVTNTPGLGAAQQALSDLQKGGPAAGQMGLAYAIAYPFGVVGILMVFLLLRRVFKVDLDHERELYRQKELLNPAKPDSVHLVVRNPSLFKQALHTLDTIFKEPFIVSRIQHNGRIFTPSPQTVLQEGDILLIVAPQSMITQLKLVIGPESDTDLKQQPSPIISRKIAVTRREVTKEVLGEIGPLQIPNYTLTRINRAGIEFVPDRHVYLQLGDRITVVGTQEAISKVERALGNSLKRLDTPELAPIFLGIALGVVLGSLPIFIPGVPIPVKIGMAGGPLIIALLISRFGQTLRLYTYVTHSANLMIREVGLVLFLASIGLGSGEGVGEAFKTGVAWQWMGMGAVITFFPLLIMGLIAHFIYKKTYFETCGLLAGASTDPPALAFTLQAAQNDAPAISYATVYPLTMIMRIIIAELMIVFFAT